VGLLGNENWPRPKEATRIGSKGCGFNCGGLWLADLSHTVFGILRGRLQHLREFSNCFSIDSCYVRDTCSDVGLLVVQNQPCLEEENEKCFEEEKDKKIIP